MGLSIGIGLAAVVLGWVVVGWVVVGWVVAGEIGCSQVLHKGQHPVHNELVGGQSPLSLQSEESHRLRVLPGGGKHEVPLGGGLSLYGFEGRGCK